MEVNDLKMEKLLLVFSRHRSVVCGRSFYLEATSFARYMATPQAQGLEPFGQYFKHALRW